ncbi:hypothetical protein G6F57_023348 [Rhizopus arrhizus]|nr:hypothetical protein G6F57_023348 [Rhizopus arrhizus]
MVPGEAKNKKYATDVVLETHEAWKQLINGSADKKDIDATNTSVEGSPYKADSVDIPAVSISSDVTLNSILTQIILS